jgi:hypothetical protein
MRGYNAVDNTQQPLPKPLWLVMRKHQRKLLWVHMIAFVVHLVSLFALVLTSIDVYSNNPYGRTSYQVYDYVTGYNNVTKSVEPLPEWQPAFRLSLPFAVIFFVSCSVAAEYFFVFMLRMSFYSKPPILDGRNRAMRTSEELYIEYGVEFVKNIQLGRNPARWLEYFFSAPTMMGIIAYFAGVTDATTLVAVVALVATTQLFGLLAENWNAILHLNDNLDHNDVHDLDTVNDVNNNPKHVWWADPRLRSVRLLPHLLGWIPQTVAWSLIIARFAKADADTGHRMPDFVYPIVITQFILFASFGFVQLWLYWLPLTPDRAVNAEAAYAILSAVAKALLAWMVFSYVLF